MNSPEARHYEQAILEQPNGYQGVSVTTPKTIIERARQLANAEPERITMPLAVKGFRVLGEPFYTHKMLVLQNSSHPNDDDYCWMICPKLGEVVTWTLSEGEIDDLENNGVKVVNGKIDPSTLPEDVGRVNWRFYPALSATGWCAVLPESGKIMIEFLAASKEDAEYRLTSLGLQLKFYRIVQVDVRVKE